MFFYTIWHRLYRRFFSVGIELSNKERTQFISNVNRYIFNYLLKTN